MATWRALFDMTSQETRFIEKLVIQLRNGVDIEENLRLLHEHYYGLLMGRLRKRGVRRELAEELIQEAFVRVWQHREQLEEDHCEGFLWTITKRLWLKHVDKLKRPKHGAGAVEQLEDESLARPQVARALNPEREVLDRERSEILKDFVNQLPRQRKRAIILQYEYEMTVAEIAERMGITSGAVKAHLHQAKAQLKELLEAEGFEKDD